MLCLIQRVSEASVTIAGESCGAIGPGLLVFFCAERGDHEGQVEPLLRKILKLRIFPDETGRINRSVQDTDGALLIVSQFTLAADTSSGNRPGFSRAAEPKLGQALYDRFVALARAAHPQVATGRFGADMKVALVNDGPFTISLHAPAC